MNFVKRRYSVSSMAALLLIMGCSASHESLGHNESRGGSASALEPSRVCSALCEAFQSNACKGKSADSCEPDCLSQIEVIPSCSELVTSMLDCRAKAVTSERDCRVYYLLFSDASCAAEAQAVGQCFLDATRDADTDCAAFCKHAYQDACTDEAQLQLCLENCPLFVNTSKCKTELNSLYHCGSQQPVEQFECERGAPSFGASCEATASAYGVCEGANGG